MSPLMALWTIISRGFPRVSGDEPVNVGFIWSDMLFSPRERG